MGKATEFFLWGVLGGGLVDGLEFVKLIRKNRGKFPPGFWRLGQILGELVRLLIGGALSVVFFVSGQVTTPLAAVTIGITAPIIIERLLRDPPKSS